jgi:hypothetical protein
MSKSQAQLAAEKAKATEKATPTTKVDAIICRLLSGIMSLGKAKLTPIVLAVSERCQKLEITAAAKSEPEGFEEVEVGAFNARSYAAEVSRIEDKDLVGHLAHLLENRNLTVEYFTAEKAAE